MAFTEAQLVAQLDPDSSGRDINMARFIPGPVLTDIYAVGVVAPYAGRSRWVTVSSTATATVAAAALAAGLTA